MLSTSAAARLAILLLVTAAWTISAQTAADEDLPTGINTKSTAEPLDSLPASSTVAAPASSSIKAPEQQLQAQPGPTELTVSTPAAAAAAAAAVLKPADATPLASTPQPAGTPAQTAEPQPAANTPEQPALPEPTALAAVVPATAPAATEPAGVPATHVPGPVPASTPADAPRVPAAEQPKTSSGLPAHCPPPFDTQQYKTTTFADNLKSTVSIHPKRPSAAVPMGGWIQGRATHYGADEKLEAAHVACGEPEAQFGVIEHGSCGYTNSDGSLPFPREMYAAVADTNEDYPGSCGRCYQVRCRTGAVQNNGRALRVSDLPSYRPYQIKDNTGRDWPGNPKLEDDIFWTKCWDDEKVVTVRVGDSCPCRYPIKDSKTGRLQEIRTQNWCCGGNNHFDLSFWAFEQLAHPSYGVMPIEYRPVACDSGAPLLSLPGFVNSTIYEDSIQPGWTWMPYNAKNTVLLAKGAGIGGSTGTCATLSKNGAVQFLCRQCSRPGYQPFAKAKALKFDIRSNTQSADPFASSTPAGELPALKIFLMNADKGTYCGQEVILTAASGYATKVSGDWYRVSIPLPVFACDAGSVGGMAAVDRFDLQNINIRDADICLDNIAVK